MTPQRREHGEEGQTLEAAPEVFVPGKPVTDIWARSGLYWHDVLKAHVTGPLIRPYFRFVRNDQARFDLDNLVYPVVAVTGLHLCTSIWATVAPGPVEGVFISEAEPPPPPAEAVSIHVANPSVGSVAGRPPVVELAGAKTIGDSGPLGLALAFDDYDVVVGTLSYDGPTKSLIDDLAPLFGTAVVNNKLQGNDHRVKELRITRGHRPQGHGVTVCVWELSSPGAAAERSAVKIDFFSHDDAGYLGWLRANPAGYVLNCEAQPKPSYLMLHRAACPSVSGEPSSGSAWTVAYAKACARTRTELDTWAVERTGAGPTPCGLCHP